MIRYNSLNRLSGVVSYEIGEDFIAVQFKEGGIYLYNYDSTGFKNIEEMKRLAVGGKGLATFINKYVRKRYSKKLR